MRTRTKRVTAQQQLVLSMIRNYEREHGTFPSAATIGETLEMTPDSAYRYLRKLEDAGFVRRTGHRERPFEFTEVGLPNPTALARLVPLLHTAAEGLCLKSENIAGYWPVPLDFLGDDETAVMIPDGEGRLLTVLVGPLSEHQLVAISHRGRVSTSFHPGVPTGARILGQVLSVIERVNESWAQGGLSFRGTPQCLAA